MNTKTVIYIAGATASGKSTLAVELALALDTCIISADSRQFYKGMEIGTAVLPESERKGVLHKFIQFLDPTQAYSAGNFEHAAISFTETWFQTHDTLILTGGSGLYARAYLYGFAPSPDVSPEIRKQVELDLKNKGLRSLQDELKHKDPDLYITIDLNNPRRLTRAIEVIRQNGVPFSQIRKAEVAPRHFKVISIGLEWERDALYARINQRVLQMLENGLEAEVKALLDKGYTADLPALRAVGYPEMILYLQGAIPYAEMVEKIQQHTRNYAKRQMTWLRKEPHLHWMSPESPEAVLEYIQKAGSA